MRNSFIPQDFEPPTNLDTDYFHLRILEDKIAELDFEAVMSSQKSLQGVFGPGSEWPTSQLTIEKNIEDLKVHKQEFESRTAFAYSVFNSSKEKCLGSVYIDPSQSPNYDCEVYFWIRDDSIALEEELYQAITTWLDTTWPFYKIVFPGRTITWEKWAKELKVG